MAGGGTGRAWDAVAGASFLNAVVALLLLGRLATEEGPLLVSSSQQGALSMLASQRILLSLIVHSI